MKNLKSKFFYVVYAIFGAQMQYVLCEDIKTFHDHNNLTNSIPWPKLKTVDNNFGGKDKVAVKQLGIPIFDNSGSVLQTNPASKRNFITYERRHAISINTRRLSMDLVNRNKDLVAPDSVARRRRMSFNHDYISRKVPFSLLCTDLPLSPSGTQLDNGEEKQTEQNKKITRQQEARIRATLALQNFHEETQSDDPDISTGTFSNISNIKTKGHIRSISSFATIPYLESFEESYQAEEEESEESRVSLSSSSTTGDSGNSANFRPNVSLKSSKTTALRRNSRFSRNNALLKQKQIGVSASHFDINAIPKPKNNNTKNLSFGNQQLQLETLFKRKKPKQKPELKFVSSYKLPMYEYVPPARPVKVIVSIDGGGSRGIIPLFYLLAMYRSLGLEYNSRLPVDMFVGTSVGAIVATAAIIGQLKELHEQFVSLVQAIFPPQYWFVALWRMLVYGYKYPAEGREKSIKSFLTPEVEKLIEQEKKTAALVIPFCSAKTHEIFLYKNYGPVQFKIFEALMASTAAPTYFPPYMVNPALKKKKQQADDISDMQSEEESEDEDEAFNDINVIKAEEESEDEQMDYIGKIEGTDGGCVANNPVLLALLAAMKKFPGAKIRIISIGTGTSRPEGHATDKLSLLSWATKSPTLFLDLQRALANYMVSELASVESDRFEYTRINTILDNNNCITDGVDPKFLMHLEDLARLSISADGSAYEAYKKSLRFMKERLEELRR